jgi:hypothetical protein
MSLTHHGDVTGKNRGGGDGPKEERSERAGSWAAAAGGGGKDMTPVSLRSSASRNRISPITQA